MNHTAAVQHPAPHIGQAFEKEHEANDDCCTVHDLRHIFLSLVVQSLGNNRNWKLVCERTIPEALIVILADLYRVFRGSALYGKAACTVALPVAGLVSLGQYSAALNAAVTAQWGERHDSWYRQQQVTNSPAVLCDWSDCTDIRHSCMTACRQHQVLRHAADA